MVVVVAIILASTLGVSFFVHVLGVGTHKPAAIYGFATVCTFLSLWLILGAAFDYLNVGQAKKIDVISGFYTPDTIADYFEQFWSGRDGFRVLVRNYRTAVGVQKAAAADSLIATFRTLFADDFGLRVYVVPVALLVAVGSIVLFLGYTGGIGLAVALSSGLPSPVQPLGIKLDLVSLAAIFGAYTWVASDVIVRSRQWTLHPSDLAWYALRLLVAIPLGQALALTVGGADVTGATTPATLPTGAGAFVAFVVSMFSLDAITNALGTAAKRFGVQMASGADEGNDLIVKLPGVDDVNARALRVEGVNTIAQLVAVDPIRTSMRTGLPFEYVLNLIDGALLWVFVGDKLKQLCSLGLRGASDVLALDEAWREADASAAALATLRQSSAAVELARKNDAAAQETLVKAKAPPGTDAATLAALQGAAADTAAAVTAAEAAQVHALSSFLSAPASQPGPAADRQAMLAALVVSVKDDGPGLTATGVETIAARLRTNSYAVFVRRLLES
jgi:hypothetical protein